MSELGTYSFLPWLRRGLANQIMSPDGDPSVRVRAHVDVHLDLRGEKLGGGVDSLPVDRPVALYGPSDIVGVESRAIVRVEPRQWVATFEPNHLAFVEFYDEDFPWRYTPAAPDLAKGRLRPWLTLLVLTEAEFVDKVVRDAPLPSIELASLDVLPAKDDLWAWAHVHVNRTLAASPAEFVSRDMAAVIPRFEATLAENPDFAYSRLLCPRKLAESTAYHAFLIPTFEGGRRACLDLEIGDIPATMSAWDPAPRPEGSRFPYYYRWSFTTGTTGDFETLVRLLQPRVVDPRVGTREMDVQFPGSNVRGVDKPELGGILKLGGALRPPSKSPPEPPDAFETWDEPFPRPLQVDLARIIDLPDDYQAAGDPDPIVTPPLYGTWHALTKRVLSDRGGAPLPETGNWVHELNLDPRFRVAAGFGTRVVQDQQERFMDAAWEQVGDVLEAQRRIRFAQFGLQASRSWWTQGLVELDRASTQKALTVLAPLNARILASDTTIHDQLGKSLVQPTMTSTALRRMIRPRGRLIRSLPFDRARPPDQLIHRVNAGEASAAPPRVPPAGAMTTGALADSLLPPIPAFLVWLLRSVRLLPVLALVALLLLAIALLVALPLAAGVVVAVLLAAAAVVAYRALVRWQRRIHAVDTLRESEQTPAAVDELPGVSNFTITEPGSGFVPTSGADSPEARRFKGALRESFELLQASAAAGAVPVRGPIDVSRVVTGALGAVDPARTIPHRVGATISVPPRIVDDLGDAFVEPMAYPVIDVPMYEPLKDRSAELFLPNINLIQPNTITLLETNQRFIESYLVGLNHEFARELLWREYPTDQRGSTFRQFWDVRGFLDADGLDEDALREKLRDILPLHRWSSRSDLGDHDNREVGDVEEEELVLVIRGELLKRYPNTVVYAHRACWQRHDDGSAADRARDPCLRSGGIDNTQERRLAPLTPAEALKPPRTTIRTPLYEAKVDPDIYFLGFDLKVEDAQGGTGESPNDDPGWFFVLKERPGEPRFGLDTDQQESLDVWNDLSWPDVQPQPAGSFIQIAAGPPAFTLTQPGPGEEEKDVQHAEDRNVGWNTNVMSSAELAYVLFQVPVLVAVHASEMLPR